MVGWKRSRFRRPDEAARYAKFLLREGTSFPSDLGLRSELDMGTVPASTVPTGFQVNRPSTTFEPPHDLPQGFLEFLAPLHRRFAPRQMSLIEERKQILAES